MNRIKLRDLIPLFDDEQIISIMVIFGSYCDGKPKLGMIGESTTIDKLELYYDLEVVKLESWDNCSFGCVVYFDNIDNVFDWETLSLKSDLNHAQ